MKTNRPINVFIASSPSRNETRSYVKTPAFLVTDNQADAFASEMPAPGREGEEEEKGSGAGGRGTGQIPFSPGTMERRK